MLANTATIRVGRLLEIRADEGYRTVADVDRVFDAIAREVGTLDKSESHVTVVDWRRCPVMSPIAATRMAQRIQLTNGRTERSAALANQNSPVAVLQFLRVIREANLPDRKLFFDMEALVEWLSPVLTEAEVGRLVALLDEGTPGPAPSTSRPASRATRDGELLGGVADRAVTSSRRRD
jgi:hypothetical protein